ncbi:5'-AMP-activated protein kinase subunit beta-2-like isoform X2 [Liolophura sinensis]|uniref:5'-AMP-activated protein kinase subunit beta-2-like isoform X2 n=1 Tax=Liolophura sinensis TaxID=3198878 RepID=UPI0031580CD9
MGNSTSGKTRQISGEDSGPSMTLYAQPSLDDSSDNFEAGAFKYATRQNYDNQFEPLQRARANTLSPGPTPMTSKNLPTVFKWDGGGKEVAIGGSFNNWKTKIPLVKSQGEFYTIIDLPEGDHQYKFYVDGQWVHNAAEPTATNDLGTLNNIVKVKKSDFEVFEALDIDSKNAASSKKHAEVSGSPPGEYGQEIPMRRPNEKHSGPPILPPHLLQVILNKDTPVHCEPTLLPEPNHVMLNHLYALSIKDGVMVLSATHRFRKKYVTTLLYKPI